MATGPAEAFQVAAQQPKEEELKDMRWAVLVALLLPVAAQAQSAGPVDLKATLGGKSGTLTIVSGGPKLRFVERTSGADRELTGALSFYGGPVVVEASFDDEQEDETIEITLTWNSATGSERMTLVARRSLADRLVYRTDEFYVTPEPTDDQPAP
jgi:hypothetical protein